MKVADNLQGMIADQVIRKEYTTAHSNQTTEMRDFEEYVDMFDAIRSSKRYDWMSDIFIPEFPIHLLTQSAKDVSQYFSTRDFVETYVMGDAPEDIPAAEAAEELINRTLNRRNLYHYIKYVRAKLINHLSGDVYLEARWDAQRQEFNYEVFDTRNVFTSKEYTYTLQDKEFVILRDEVTYADLVADKKANKYENLDAIKDMKTKGMTVTYRETIAKDKRATQSDTDLNKNFDRYKRYGKYWVKGDKPGINPDGTVMDGATLEEVIITVVSQGGKNFLIGFNRQPYKDWAGNPYRPIIRGICYVHPTQDGGVGDGKYNKELQIGINDNFNMGNDRTSLATFPTLKAKKYVMEDTDSLYIAPGHVMELEDPATDVTEMIISDNITGTIANGQMLKSKMDEAMAIFPGNVGQVPGIASTTATAVAGAASSADTRGNYKALTYENTALAELYWMIIQMTSQFAPAELGILLMGDRVYDFNPALDYHFRPLSQSIESEQSKDTKIQRWIQLYQSTAAIGHPDAGRLLNFIMAQISELMGKEFQQFGDMLLDESVPIDQGGAQSAEAPGDVPVSNEQGIPQSQDEQFARQ